MKTIFVLSDTHGNKKAIDKFSLRLIEADYVFHLGDVVSDAEYIRKKYNPNTINVLGNCDNMLNCDEKVVEIEKVKFLLCHGHQFRVKSTLDRLFERGTELGVDICLFGHTHIPIIEKYGAIKLINPGSMSRSCEPTYCYITVVNDKCFSKIVAN